MEPTPGQAPRDEERAQARARIAITTLVLIGCGAWWLLASAPPPGIPPVMKVVAAYLVLALAWAVLVKRYPGHYVSRRATVIIGDMAVTAYGTYMLGAYGAILYTLFLWVIVGNGMRYGARYMYATMAAGVVAFGTVIATSPVWRQQLPTAFGLMLALVVLPLFYLSLFRRLHVLNAKLGSEGEALRRTQDNLAEYVAQLEHALQHVKQLQGIIPICAHCKKVRDDQNFWQSVEQYISTRSSAEFSHGICPDCYVTAMREIEAFERRKDVS